MSSHRHADFSAPGRHRNLLADKKHSPAANSITPSRDSPLHHEAHFASHNFFQSTDLGLYSYTRDSFSSSSNPTESPYSSARPSLSRTSSFSSIASFGSIDSGVSHPPRPKQERKKIVKLRYNELTNQSTRENPLPDKMSTPSFTAIKYPTAQELEPANHIRKHSSTLKCHLCPKKFTRASRLRSHMKRHTAQRPFACAVCDKSFTRNHDRQRHEDLHRWNLLWEVGMP